MFDQQASPEALRKTLDALQAKGYRVDLVDFGSLALEKIKELIPKEASVTHGSSVTLEQIGFVGHLKSGSHGWDDLHARVTAENDAQKRKLLRRQTALSDYYLGSVHALTQSGEFVVASNSGSQLPSIVSTSHNLIFVVGIQKIVPTVEEGLRRVETYVYPLEDTRMKELYGRGTALNKIVIFRGESPKSGRSIHFILVKEKLGF